MSRVVAASVVLVTSGWLAGCSLLFPFEPAPVGDDGDGGRPGEDVLTDGGDPDGGSCRQILSTYVTRAPVQAALVLRQSIVVTWESSGTDTGGADRIDASDPRLPRRVQSVTLRNPVDRMAVSDCPRCLVDDQGRSAERAFVAGGAGVEVLVTQPRLAVVGRLLVDGGARDVAAEGRGYSAVAGLSSGGLAVIDVGALGDDASHAQALTDQGVGLSLACAPRRLAMFDARRGALLVEPGPGCPAGLWLFDLTAPEPLHVVPVEDEVSDVVVVDQAHLLLAGGFTGLWRVTLQGDREPLVQQVTTAHDVTAVAVERSTAFAVGPGALTVLDLRGDETTPVVAEIELPGDGRAISLWDGKALVAAGDAGLLFVDVGCLLPEIELDDGRGEMQ